MSGGAHGSPTRGTLLRAGVLGAVLVAAVNAALGLRTLSFARDEGFSVSTSLRSWPSLIHTILTTETNGWLYSVLLRAWSVVGIDPGTLRIPSAVAFVATVPVAAWIALRLFGPRVAALTAWGIALNGSLLMYAQQIRGYAIAVLLASAATAAFIADVRRPRRSTWWAWVLLSAATAACQLQMITVLLAHLTAVLALPAAERHWRRRLAAVATATLLSLPTAISVLQHEEGQQLLGFRFGVFRDTLLTFSGRSLVMGTLAFGTCGIALARQLARSSRNESLQNRFGEALVLAWAVVPFTALLVASLIQPTLIGRYMLFCVPAVVLALAWMIDRLLAVRGPRRSIALAAAVTLAAASAVGSVRWHLDSGTEDWDDVTAYVFDNAEPLDRLVVANDSVRLFFEYQRRLRTPTPTEPMPGYPAQAWGEYQTGDQTYRAPSAAELRDIAVGAQRIWVVYGTDHVDTDVMPKRLTSLAGSFRQEQLVIFPGDVQVRLLVRID